MSLPKPYYEDGAVTIYNADCREILPELPKVDLVLTDPPYGIAGGTGGNARNGKGAYSGAFDDTPEFVHDVVVPIIRLCITTHGRVIVTPGVRCLWEYPATPNVGCMWAPASASYTGWGAQTFQPILYYGKDPRAGRGQTPSGRQSNEAAPKNGHPCPKPERFWKWLLHKGSVDRETILDPFMGSGTTLRAAKDLGRKAIGVEIEERYCEIAARRMAQEVLAL
ncbi:MAG: DNA-methyltransferase [Alphaproteobacteria bacterium]